MKNQYVGDIGDYGKYGLLRYLAENGIRIGVNWYLTRDDGSADGKFTGYLSDPAATDRGCDPELYDALKKILLRRDPSERTVQEIEETSLIPNATYYGQWLRSADLEPSARELERRLWFNNSCLLLESADLIFADPDNGISFQKTARTKDSEKYILPEEVAAYYSDGKDVVYYCHKGRRKPEAWEKAKTDIRRYIRDAQSTEERSVPISL